MRYLQGLPTEILIRFLIGMSVCDIFFTFETLLIDFFLNQNAKFRFSYYKNFNYSNFSPKFKIYTEKLENQQSRQFFDTKVFTNPEQKKVVIHGHSSRGQIC